MTNLEALQSLVNLDLPNLHEKVLIDNSVNLADAYVKENEQIIELCSAYIYKVELTHPDFSEGKLRIAANAANAKELRILMNAIFDKNNLENETVRSKPKIQITTL